ncbi:MAG: endolytic transglycosylase MltG [Betaproteobacteria bacterium]|nr:endolytic transglycosylase MltG [Betaproteobacteria bacterium]PWB62014.1 MAG: endolytic transglycosylase MltG [Betaproteobacteria bacterium]
MRAARRLALLVAAVVLAAVAWGAWFCLTPLEPPRSPFDFTVKSGASLKGVARQLADEGLLPEPYAFWLLGRAMGKAGVLQAGTYRVAEPLTPLELLDKLARGDVLPIEIAFVEGTTFRQWLAQMRANPNVRSTLAGRGEAEIRAALGVEEAALEGLFFPDTYRFVAGTTDVEILRRAYAQMQRRLARAWESRDPALPLASPYEALVLASIVEKETGRLGERAIVASVFVNRLRRGMRLQTDPTVIYGLGEGFDGNLRKRDLQADTPWNTYTRDGLPPTPIAMPGAASLEAATRPASTEFLYFVGKGDGSHQFSRNLEDHNRAVAKYQLGRS